MYLEYEDYTGISVDIYVLRRSPLASQVSSSIRATGGVYKGQGHIPGGLVNQPVRGIPSWDRDQQLTMVCPHRE